MLRRQCALKRRYLEAIVLAQPQDAELGLADSRGILQDSVEHGFEFAGRT
jgi:hypothetical protein